MTMYAYPITYKMSAVMLRNLHFPNQGVYLGLGYSQRGTRGNLCKVISSQKRIAIRAF